MTPTHGKPLRIFADGFSLASGGPWQEVGGRERGPGTSVGLSRRCPAYLAGRLPSTTTTEGAPLPFRLSRAGVSFRVLLFLGASPL